MNELIYGKVSEETEVKTGGVDFGCQRYGVGRNTMRKIADDAGAVVKIGRRWLFNVSKVDRYMDSLSE